MVLAASWGWWWRRFELIFSIFSLHFFHLRSQFLNVSHQRCILGVLLVCFFNWLEFYLSFSFVLRMTYFWLSPSLFRDVCLVNERCLISSSQKTSSIISSISSKSADILRLVCTLRSNSFGFVELFENCCEVSNELISVRLVALRYLSVMAEMRVWTAMDAVWMLLISMACVLLSWSIFES